MLRGSLIKIGLTIGILFNAGLTETASATSAGPIGRTIFAESPQTVERYFGRYWTRLTQTDAQGNTTRIYTYNPARFRGVFPESKRMKFYITFVNDRAQSVHLEDMSTYLNRVPDRMDSFYEVVFGYRPSLTNPVYHRLVSDPGGANGTLQGLAYCMEPGTALAFEAVSVAEIATFAMLSRDARCNASTPAPQ
ncbi:hypothetical protein [Leptolyngbya sp. FACHB-261]|uniref:hypothetical protein n=1 Tax=Leptolyngbya sp. FACHB-261 TaxID=2692806 RepID=UPI0016828206|nr:hypothetical protein [Leptolyngbya sp. FACHB-261]MBD2102491.1 hypothetical protein [Leptolyngbya sp. FACHB-261]